MFVAGDSNGNTYVSQDSGQTWSSNGLANPALGFGNEAIVDGHYYNGQFVIGGFSGYVYRSPDGIHFGSPIGVTYPSEINNLAVGGGYILAALSIGLYTGGTNPPSRICRSSDGGQTWTPQPGVDLGIQHNADVTALDYGNSIYVAGSPGLSRSQDGGLTWTPLFYPTDNYDRSAGDAFAKILFTGSQFLAGSCSFTNVGHGGSIYKSADGLTWSGATRFPALTSGAGFTCGALGNGVIAMGVGAFNPALGQSGMGHVFWSDDGALTWHDAGDITGAGLPLYAMAHDGTAFCASGQTGAIYRSLDGKSWTQITNVSPNAPDGTDTACMIGYDAPPISPDDDFERDDYRRLLDTRGRSDARSSALRRARRAIGLTTRAK